MAVQNFQHTGIGFRREFAEEFLSNGFFRPAFIEVAPENWIGIGGYWKRIFDKIAATYPVYLHGLSLSLGGPDKLDKKFLKEVKTFMKEYNIMLYSEHLSFAKCDNAHLYDLLPVPFRMDSAKHIAQRIQSVQDMLGTRIALEIVSYYTPVAAEMSESDFINEVLRLADCELLLDVNNIYVNAFNHNYNANGFIDTLPLEKVKYIHMAGHELVEPDLIIDTHGEPIIDEVYGLFEKTIPKLSGQVPVLLERDFNIPELQVLGAEMEILEQICNNKFRRLHDVA
ncbi:MAG: DUF692 domain-containing protein [Ignavibacteriales bacterium]|nr:DUF692 domain-containing protein [Ignavibacteriales bacterium]